jgi:hypothetical protein
LYGLPRRKEELRSEIPKAELGLAYLRAENLLSRMKSGPERKGGWSITGRIGRVIRFQLVLRWIG